MKTIIQIIKESPIHCILISFLIGCVFVAIILMPIREEQLALPVVYEVCSNYPGIESKCHLGARFMAKNQCEEYLTTQPKFDTVKTKCKIQFKNNE